MKSPNEKYIFDCTKCNSPCDSKSLGKYIFEHDVHFSEREENALIDYINNSRKFVAEKCFTEGYPDIAIYSGTGKLIQYLEVKVQRRAFMKIQKMLPQASLSPSETVALNLSDLLRYFEIFDKEEIPLSIIWVVMERSCISGKKKNPGLEPIFVN